MAEMSPLRRRMIEDMTIRNLSPATQQSYIYARLRSSAAISAAPPDRLGLEDVRAYQLHLDRRGSLVVAHQPDRRARCGSSTASRLGGRPVPRAHRRREPQQAAGRAERRRGRAFSGGGRRACATELR